ncbi:MAG: hypothetical protein LBC13_00840 [Clostridiales bacterium]|jgi:hypothetical protein|nr:hypothetical protein [Clostridiales bacterium]
MIDAQGIFNAIKTDDDELFSLAVEEKKSNLSLCYGRFPLLSLCYLYNAEKIVRKYESVLDGASPYTFVTEPYDAYVKFRSYAGRALRLYAPQGKKIIPPVEMLAVTGDTQYLADAYPRLTKSADTPGNLRKIYKTAHGESILVNADGVFAARFPMRKLWKNFILIAVIIAAVMTAAPFGVIYGLRNFYGEGTANNPLRVTNASQLQAALAAGKEFVSLEADFSLPASFSVSEYAGRLDGNGRTLRAFFSQKGLIETLSGTIENLNVVFYANDFRLTENAAPFVFTNKGALRNVGAELKGTLNEESSLESLNVSALVSVNNGEISSCSVLADVKLNGDGNGDAAFAGIAYSNNGTISGCTVKDGSSVEAFTVDLAGICAANNARGVIRNCSVYGSITQNSDSPQWSPMVAGVVFDNLGEINGTENNAELTVATSASFSYTDNSTVALARSGGIAINNKGELINVLNAGVITAHASAESDPAFVYAGGVSVSNESGMTGCVNRGAVNVSSTSSVNSPSLLAGGIVAENTETGEIIGASNNADVILTARGVDGSVRSQNVYAGGIAAYASGSITKSRSEGDIEVYVGDAQAVAGGVAGDVHSYGKVTDSCSYGKLTVSSSSFRTGTSADGGAQTYGTVMLAGGVVGILESGTISGSYSAADITVVYGADVPENAVINYRKGGIAGGAIYAGGYVTYVIIENSYYVLYGDTRGIGTLVTYGSGSLGAPSDSGTTAVADLEELKTTGVYWG